MANKDNGKWIKFQEAGADTPEHLSVEGFLAKTGISYLSHLTYESDRIISSIHQQCARGLAKGAIGTTAQWLGAFFENNIVNGDTADVLIRWIDDKIGYGLFADGPIEKGAFIGEYTGLVRRRRWLYLGVNDYCFMYPTALWSWHAYTIDALKAGNMTRYINHAATSNVEAIGVFCGQVMHVIIRAKRDLEAGEELLLDYGKRYWRHRKVNARTPLRETR